MEEQSNYSRPTVTNDKDSIIVMYESRGSSVTFFFQDIIYASGELNSTLVTSVIMPPSKERNFEARIKCQSLSSRETYARSLKSSYGKDVPWPLLLSEACKLAIDEYGLIRKQQVKVQSEIVCEPLGYVLEPFLERNAANVIFGKGGSGKTYVSLKMALCLASGDTFLDNLPDGKNIKTLFVDYESSEDVFKYRINALAKYSPNANDQEKDGIVYLHADAPLYDMKKMIRDIIKERNIGMLLVDSIALACGGSPEDSQNAIRYFNTLNSFGVTTLSIGHETKAENANQFIFGSAFFQYTARNIFNMQRDKENDDEMDIMHGCLVHRKNNNGRLRDTVGVRIYFDQNDGVDVSKESAHRFSSELGLKTRLIQLFKDGETLEAQEIYKLLSDKSPEQIKSRLTDLKNKGTLVNPTRGVWTKNIPVKKIDGKTENYSW